MLNQIRDKVVARLSSVRAAAVAMDARSRGWMVVNANLVAFGAAFISLMLLGPRPLADPRAAITFLVGGAFVFSRWLAMYSGLRSAVIVLDAIGTVIFLSVTGAPNSPFYFFALAGAWWAGNLRPPHGAVLFGVVSVAMYIVLVMPEAVAIHEASAAFEDLVALIIVAGLTDFYLALDRRALQLGNQIRTLSFAPSQLAVRSKIAETLGDVDVPVDSLLAAAQLGLTLRQTELLVYLMLGMSNQQIAEASSISVPTVKYRLTPLYAALGVRGRAAAVARARALGLGDLGDRVVGSQ
jgi:DNA-binding CsgD family transcriptional regulator